jgi:DNA-binding transcriptional ArsR family regulator
MVKLENNFEIYDIISHPVRRQIILFLHDRKRAGFTEIMQTTGENTGSLSFHLKKMENVLMRDDDQQYLLNREGERAFSMMTLMQQDEVTSYAADSNDLLVNLKKDERLIISSRSVKPLGRRYKLGGLNKSIVHDVSVALTSERLIFSSWRFFPPEEIPLSNIRLANIRQGIPLVNGDSKGVSIEITYLDSGGKIQKIRFLPPNVSRWMAELQKNIKS